MMPSVVVVVCTGVVTDSFRVLDHVKCPFIIHQSSSFINQMYMILEIMEMCEPLHLDHLPYLQNISHLMNGLFLIYLLTILIWWYGAKEGKGDLGAPSKIASKPSCIPSLPLPHTIRTDSALNQITQK